MDGFLLANTEVTHLNHWSLVSPYSITVLARHDDVMKWRHFPRNWPFVRGIHRSRWFPTQSPVTRSFDVFFDLRLNKRLSKQPWGWWFETPSCSLWRQCNDIGSGNVLLLAVTRALSERLLNFHILGLVVFAWEQCQRKCPRNLSLKYALNGNCQN